jgi:hypothetical protein
MEAIMAAFEPFECHTCRTLIEHETDIIDTDFCTSCFEEEESPYEEPEDDDDRVAREDRDEANLDDILKLSENAE